MKQLSAFCTSSIVAGFLVFLGNFKGTLGDRGVAEEVYIALII